MERMTLTFASMADVLDGGKLAIAFERELARLVADCHNCPTNKKARTLTVQVKLAPDVESYDKHEGLGRIELSYQIRGRQPSMTSATYPMRTSGKDGLELQAEAPENPDQHTMRFRRNGTEEE